MKRKLWQVLIKLVSGNKRDKDGRWATTGIRGATNRFKQWLRYQLTRKLY